MALIVKAQTAPPKPTGSFPAICVDAINAGWYPPGPKAQDPNWVQKIKLRFYYIAENDKGVEQGFYADLFATASIGKKSILGKFLEAWRGTPFTPEQREGFDLDTLIKVPCIINVVNGSTAGYVDVTSAGALSRKLWHLAPAYPDDYVLDRNSPEPLYTKHPEPTAEQMAASAAGQPIPAAPPTPTTKPPASEAKAQAMPPREEEESPIWTEPEDDDIPF